MPLNKIGAGVNLPAPAYPMSLAAGQVFMLPAGQGVVGTFGSVLYPQLASNNPFTGQYAIQLGEYCTLQIYDAALNYWRNVASGGPNSTPVTFSSDGQNFRIANSTGCPIGGLITNAGSAYTNGFYGFINSYNNSGSAVVIANGTVTAGNTTFTATPSAGGSTWNMIVGGAINTTLTLSGTVFQSQGGVTSPFGGTGVGLTGSGGTNYTRAPVILFTPPPNQGQQPYLLPTATCTISGGAVNAITVVNQGAGLLALPGITFINAPGDTTGGGALAGWTAGNSAQVGSGTLMAIWPSFYGTAVTSVPTFTFSPASSTAVTAIMNWSVTSITNTTPGAGYGNNLVAVWGGGIVAGSAANTNPILDKGINPLPIFPPTNVTNATGATVLAGPFGGVNIQATPTISVVLNNTTAQSTVAVETPNMGGNSDTFLFIPL